MGIGQPDTKVSKITGPTEADNRLAVRSANLGRVEISDEPAQRGASDPARQAPISFEPGPHHNVNPELSCLGKPTQTQAEVIGGEEMPSTTDQHLCEVSIDTPVSRSICIGKSTSCDPPTKTCMIEFGPVGAEANLGVAQALVVSQLRIGHAEKLISAGEASYSKLAVVASDAGIEFVTRQEFHQLGKHDLTGVHLSPCLPTRR